VTARFTLFFLFAAMATAAFGQEAPTPLDDLLNAHINAAAKYEQPVRDVPASVTIITAEEIERYGFETLGEALNSIRGLYTSYDRNYTGIGVRGFGRLTDYNNRVLVLIDGHPISEPVFGTVSVGTDLVLNLSAVERIEFVRGPSSVMYGTGAMFGVVNVVMKTGDGTHTASATASAGSAGFASASSSGTTSIGSANIAVSGLLRSVAGKDLLLS
jgi:outer membrane receptor for ferrienterochelin and colicins